MQESHGRVEMRPGTHGQLRLSLVLKVLQAAPASRDSSFVKTPLQERVHYSRLVDMLGTYMRGSAVRVCQHPSLLCSAVPSSTHVVAQGARNLEYMSCHHTARCSGMCRNPLAELNLRAQLQERSQVHISSQKNINIPTVLSTCEHQLLSMNRSDQMKIMQ
jgi:hypothetical protein